MDGHKFAHAIRITTRDLRQKHPGALNQDPGKSILIAFDYLALVVESMQNEIDAKNASEQADNPRSEGT